MPYTLDWQEDGVIFNYFGDTVGDELIRSNLEVYEHPNFEKMRYQIVDFLKVRNFDCTSADIRKIANMDAVAAQRNPQVCVVGITTSDLVYGFFRMYSMVGTSTTWTAEIFDSWDKAKEWVQKHRVD